MLLSTPCRGPTWAWLAWSSQLVIKPAGHVSIVRTFLRKILIVALIVFTAVSEEENWIALLNKGIYIIKVPSEHGVRSRKIRGIKRKRRVLRKNSLFFLLF